MFENADLTAAIAATATGLPGDEGWWRLSDAEWASVTLDWERLCRQAEAMRLAIWAEGQRRGFTGGYRDQTEFARAELHLTPQQTAQRNEDSAAVCGEPDIGGRLRPPRLAASGEALAAGEIDTAHVHTIQAVMRRCPTHLDDADRAKAEEILLEVARAANTAAVRKAGRKLIEVWEADGKPPNDEDSRRPSWELRMRRNSKGELVFSGYFDSDSAATLEGLLGPLAKPRREPTGDRDLRSHEERQGDALAEIIACAARGDDLTVQGGERAVLTVGISLDELTDRLNHSLAHIPGMPERYTLDDLRRLACEAAVVPAIFNAPGEVLYLGRESRHASRAQRRALALRDKGCAGPGCTRPPKWCAPHHRIPWYLGGTTDLDNLVLLCDYHHRMIHHTEWELRMSPVDGLPEFIPPERIDPEQKPIRNTAHTIGESWTNQQQRPPPEPALPHW